MTIEINETDPSVVTAITIVNNTFVLGTDTVDAVHEQVVPAASVITLPNGDVPIAGTFSLFKNGLIMTVTTDYTIADGTVTLVVAPEDTDIFTVVYVAQPEA